jgi:hypothetical protein
VIGAAEIRPFDFGYYTMPMNSSLPGQKIPVFGYTVPMPGGVLLSELEPLKLIESRVAEASIVHVLTLWRRRCS